MSVPPTETLTPDIVPASVDGEPGEHPGEPQTSRAGRTLRGWLVVVITVGSILAAAAVPPGVRCVNPDLITPGLLLLLASLPALLALHFTDELRRGGLTGSRWIAATGPIRTFALTWSFCLPVVVVWLVLGVMRYDVSSQVPLVATAVAVLGVGALSRLAGDGTSNLHRDVPEHRRFVRWMSMLWREHPWITVYLLLAVGVAAWAWFSPLSC